VLWYRVDLSASLRSCGFAVEIFRVPGSRIVSSWWRWFG